MHTGEVTKFNKSNSDELKTGGRASHTHAHLQYYLRLLQAALDYEFKDLPAAIVSINENEINWIPSIDDSNSGDHFENPPLKRAVELIYELWLDHGDVDSMVCLQKIFFQK